MPTYEYECLTNGHRFEVKQSFSDPALETCEVCGEPVRKVFSAAGIVFKGSGYYVTDTRKKAKASGDGEKSPAKAESKGESKSDAKSGAKSESAGASKGPAKTDAKPSSSSSGGSAGSSASTG